MRYCKCGCGQSIEHKHVNAKFLDSKHKDHYHNTTNPERLKRAKDWEAKKMGFINSEQLEDYENNVDGQCVEIAICEYCKLRADCCECEEYQSYDF